MRKSIGVVLCTYNGEKYLRQQIDSILAQTRAPDQILILDDGSKDGTVAILDSYAKTDPRIRFIQNDTNLGFIRNFEKGIALCETDFIALSDQDDIWLPEKLAQLAAQLEAHPGAGIAFCNAEFMLADGTRTGHPVYPPGNGYTDDYAKARAGILERRWNALGNFILMEADFKRLILPNPAPRSLPHDLWVCLVAYFLRQPRYVAEPLSLYRLHPGMASGLISSALKGTPFAHRKKPWYHPLRLSKNLKRALLSPFTHGKKVRERRLRAYHLAIDMHGVLVRLLEQRQQLSLPALAADEQRYLRDRLKEWSDPEAYSLRHS